MSEPHAQVVIVGAGVAGGLIAWQLARSGISVILLEAGPRRQRWELVERFRNSPTKDFMSPYPSVAYAPHPEVNPETPYLIQKGEHPYNAQYVRTVGGTTWHWAAAAWRLLPNDFRLNSLYGVGRDWPIDYEALEPFYCLAETALGVAGPDDQELDSPRSRPYPMAPLPLSWMDQRFRETLNHAGYHVVTEPMARNSRPYDQRPACCGNNNCMPICPIAAQYFGARHVEKAERAGANLIPGAVVYQIEADSRGIVRAVRFRDPRRQDYRITGDLFILAAHGIETPKLMLLSRSAGYPDGIGNRSGMVGRNLMDHPGVSASFMAEEALWPGRGPQEMTSVVNLRDGAFRAEYAAKKLHLSNMVNNRKVTEDLIKKGIMGRKLNDEIRRRAAHLLTINSFHEQLPEPQNRIIPSDTRVDAIGIPQPEIYYSIGEYVRRSAGHTRAEYRKIGRLMGASDVRMKEGFYNNNHIMGTTIMGGNPMNSVVDGDCRSHDHPNLFIAGSSVMPSAASVNPTLTIAALSLRIADQVKREVP